MVSVSGIDVKFGRIVIVIGILVGLIVIYNRYGSGQQTVTSDVDSISEQKPGVSKSKPNETPGLDVSADDNVPEAPEPLDLKTKTTILTTDQNSCSVTYQEVAPDDADDTLPKVLLLHGAAFNASTWNNEIGTMKLLKEWGYRAVAVDLKPPTELEKCTAGLEEAKGVLIHTLVVQLDLSHVVLISPSKSGEYSIPYITEQKYKEELAGFIALAPIISGNSNFNDFTDQDRDKVLILRGSEDNMVPESQLADLQGTGEHSAKLINIPGGGHPWYKDDPKTWHEQLKSFLDKV